MSILMCESGGHTDGEMNILGYCTCCAEQYGSRYDFIAVLSDMWNAITSGQHLHSIVAKSAPLHYWTPVPSTFAVSLPPSLHDLLAFHLWSPSFILQFSHVSSITNHSFRCAASPFSPHSMSVGSNTALLCRHSLIPDLLSTYFMVSFILGWKLTSSLLLFLLSLSLSLLCTDLTDYCPAGL